MTETKKKKNKQAILSEDNMSLILRRYSANTIIALLQEVSQFLDAKIDWNELVKKTSIGIANPRECQMLWRHLAYRDDLDDDLEDGAEPLDDDSDLESELEAFPPVSAEASAEAAACAKVLLASGSQSNSGPPNRSTVEAPLTINIPNPNGQSSRAASDDPQAAYAQGTNITVPVSVQKQPFPSVTPTEGLEGNGAAGGSGFPARRKRKPWTEEEDMELIAAVEKCGERNWANIVKGGFKGDRTASQLSQRWAIIRKRQANLNSGGTSIKVNTQLSEQQLANRAVSHALNMPVGNSLLSARSVGAAHSSIASGSAAVPSAADEASPVPNRQTLHQTGASLPKGTSSSTTKSQVTAPKGPSVPVGTSSGPNAMVTAAAVAAGARIATFSTAASLLKAARSKNALHIRPGGAPVIKMSMPGSAKPLATNPSGSRPNVHYIRTGLPPVSVPLTDRMPNIPQTSGSQKEHDKPLEPPTLTGLITPITDTTTNLAAQQTISGPSPSATSCGTAGDSKEDNKSSEKIKDGGTANVLKESTHGKGGVLDSGEVSETQMTDVTNPRDLQSMEVDENDQPPLVNTK